MATHDPQDTRDAAAAHRDQADQHATKKSLIGTDRYGHASNVSWGAIFAGVVTFLALMVVFAAVTVGLGLSAGDVAAGVWSVAALLLALAAAGYVAGALAVRGGLLHGFLAWAAAQVAAVMLATLATANLFGAVGGVIGQATEVTNVDQAIEVIEETLDQEDINEAEQTLRDIEQQAGDAADTAEASVWWAVGGMVLGAGVAAAAGMLGSRTVAAAGGTATRR